jgi:1-phosphofructokinase family hexose kinase
VITAAGLSPSLDITYSVDALRLGAIHRPTGVVRCAGGKALNMIRAAATLGASGTVVAVLGGVTGEFLRTALEEAGIEVVLVETPAETRTCVSIGSADTGALTEVYETAAPLPDDVWQHFTARAETTLRRRPGWLSISGGAPHGLGADALAQLVGLGAAAGVRVALDSHGPALPQAVDAAPALVKINRYEAAALLHLPTTTALTDMAEQIRDRTGGTVVLTDGQHGALALDGSTAVHAEIPAVIGRFPVGSGDSFLGGLLAELDQGAELADALRTATAAGVANALVPGPGVFEASAVQSLRAQVVLRRL